MSRHRPALVLLALLSLAVPASAGIFGKKEKPDPKVRVPELIATVKNDKDESKRAAAAEELRQYDVAAFPDIVPVLIDVLLTDPKPAVRSEAADSLGKIRPISQEAGWALEQALAKDGSMRVRLRARYALMSYHWAGYQGKPKESPAPPKDAKPAVPAPPPAKDAPKALRPVPAPGRLPLLHESPPPPLAEPRPAKPTAPPPGPGPEIPPPPSRD